ncbi:MAG: MFS transporter [Alphaproteobacteria bacterium]|nr:MFS transporter [Alphaproteobacteria bacterium]
MASFASFAALVLDFMKLWSMSATDAGWIGGIYFVGYVIGAPLLGGLTDRIDARRIYFWSSVLTAVSVAGFILFAEGFWTAMLFRALTGLGLSGTYMPGLKALTDRIEKSEQSRYVAFYTASFGVGASLSYVVTGYMYEALTWQWAFASGAAGSVIAAIVVLIVLKPVTPASPEGGEGETHFLDFRPVFANRPAMGFILAYTVHNLELFGLRAWIVAYLAFSQTRLADTAQWWDAVTIAAIVNIAGWAASVSGNEAAVRWGRRPVITVVMWSSTLLACIIGFTSGLPFWFIVVMFLIYGMTVTGDSAAITAGTVASAREGQRGATLAMHSTIGFTGSALGPVLFGWVLDLGGGETDPTAWGLAFAAMGVAVFLGPVALWFLSRRPAKQA